MLASDITSRAALVLQDDGNVRWTTSELYKWISDGQRVIALVRPDSCAKNETLTLVAGTRQTIPATGIRLLDVIRNINANNTPGRVVRIVDRESLDAQDYNWHNAAAGPTINFTQDNRDPDHFYVYPPAAAGQKLEILYSANPTEVTSGGQTLSVNDIYAEPLFNYVLYRAYSKDAEFGGNAALAQGYVSMFNALLGLKTSKDFAFSPDANKPGASPNVMAVRAGGV
ncbi:MAG: hypothetical protein RL745_979 [Actinomycetota bacterium]|jgi:hypothetical protein